MKHMSCLIWGIIEESVFSLGSLKGKSVSLLLKFHENGDESLNIYKAAENKMWNTENGIEFFNDCADALEHIHKCGFPHNLLKANKVVLKKHDDQVLHNTKMVSVKYYTFREISMVDAVKAAFIGGWQLFGSSIY